MQQEIEFMSAWEHNPTKRKMRIANAILHLFSQSAYHRGQIIQLLKGYTNELPVSTYIMWASKVIG